MEDLVGIPVPEWHGLSVAIVKRPEDSAKMINISSRGGISTDKNLYIAIVI